MSFPARVVVLVLIALPWLWPFTSGPTAAAQPYLIAVAAAALLLVASTRQSAYAMMRAAALGWLVAALLSSLIALLQYFDAEAPFHPWVNSAAPGLGFGNLRQPNQLATLLVIGLMALRWWGQQGAARPGAWRSVWGGNRGQITISAHQLRQIGVNVPQADAGLQANQNENVAGLRQPLVCPAAIGY